MRPKVVLFGEALDIVGGGENLDTLPAQMRQSFDAVFSVGTTSVSPYIAAPVVMGARGGPLAWGSHATARFAFVPGRSALRLARRHAKSCAFRASGVCGLACVAQHDEHTVC